MGTHPPKRTTIRRRTPQHTSSAKEVEVPMHCSKTANGSTQLDTGGLGPCIAVGIIYRNRSFLFHSPDLIVEKGIVTDPFFKLLDKYIPTSERETIPPVIAGGGTGMYDDSELDSPIDEEILNARDQIKKRLREAGFKTIRAFWAEKGDSQSLRLDIKNKKAILEIDSPGSEKKRRCLLF